MASDASRFIVRVVVVVALIGGAATVAFLIASNSADDGPPVAGPSPSAGATTSPRSPVSPGRSPESSAPERCRTVAQGLAEIDFAIRDTWDRHHARARRLDRPRDKGAVYRDAARYFGILEVRLRGLQPEGPLLPIRDLLARAIETSIDAAGRLASAFATGDDARYQQGVDILNRSSAYHDAADRQLRAVDCEAVGG